MTRLRFIYYALERNVQETLQFLKAEFPDKYVGEQFACASRDYFKFEKQLKTGVSGSANPFGNEFPDVVHMTLHDRMFTFQLLRKEMVNYFRLNNLYSRFAQNSATSLRFAEVS